MTRLALLRSTTQDRIDAWDIACDALRKAVRLSPRCALADDIEQLIEAIESYAGEIADDADHQADIWETEDTWRP